MAASAIQNNSSNSTPVFQLHPAPNWQEIFPKYDRIRCVWEKSISFSDSINDKSTNNPIMNTLKQHSSCPSEKELHKFNFGMSESSFYNGVAQSLDLLKLFRFSDGTQKTMSIKNININDEKRKAVIVSIDKFSKTYSEYQQGLSEYCRDSKGIGTSGDKELYFSKSGMNTMGHVAVAYLSETSDKYDLFDTSNTVVGKYRISLAMNESYHAQENHSSASQFSVDDNKMVDLQGEIACSALNSDSCHLCNQYCLAYLLARQVSNNHAAILNFFQRELILHPKEFISTIAGINPAKQQNS
jgi:hypothetical protein